MFKYAVLAVILLAVTGLILAIVLEELPPPGQRYEFRIALYDFAGVQLFYLAREKGVFAESQVNVILPEYSPADPSMDGLPNTSALLVENFARTVSETGYDALVLPLVEVVTRRDWLLRQKTDLRVVAGVFEARDVSPPVVFKRQEMIRDVRNLTQHKIGYVPHTIGDYAWLFIINAAELPLEDLEDITNADVSVLAANYEQGVIQAYSALPPHSWRLQDRLKSVPLERERVPKELFTHVLAVRADWLNGEGTADHERRLRLMIQGLFKAVRYFRFHRAAAREILLRDMPDDDRAKHEQFIEGGIDYLDLATNLRRFRAGQPAGPPLPGQPADDEEDENFQAQLDRLWAGALSRYTASGLPEEPRLMGLADPRYLTAEQAAAPLPVAPPVSPPPEATPAGP